MQGIPGISGGYFAITDAYPNGSRVLSTAEESISEMSEQKSMLATVSGPDGKSELITPEIMKRYALVFLAVMGILFLLGFSR